MDKNILMEMTDNRQWLAAIRTDDHAYVSKILDTSTRLDREKLLHGKLEISATNRSDESKEPETRFERPFILALVSGSVKVFQVMMRYDVDICVSLRRSCTTSSTVWSTLHSISHATKKPLSRPIAVSVERFQKKS